eukprot:TRINITY_DN12536_c0_g1_i1.p1 TRINITY_DN12536_c0_g1~~TRINITY_DN12536_c0_g1_i1.p1  ORF type:complete len:231 (-),score=49.22 TRINITY_DN12536_c0_g1_i1:163-855(-)
MCIRDRYYEMRNTDAIIKSLEQEGYSIMPRKQSILNLHREERGIQDQSIKQKSSNKSHSSANPIEENKNETQLEFYGSNISGKEPVHSMGLPPAQLVRNPVKVLPAKELEWTARGQEMQKPPEDSYNLQDNQNSELIKLDERLVSKLASAVKKGRAKKKARALKDPATMFLKHASIGKNKSGIEEETSSLEGKVVIEEEKHEVPDCSAHSSSKDAEGFEKDNRKSNFVHK